LIIFIFNILQFSLFYLVGTGENCYNESNLKGIVSRLIRWMKIGMKKGF
jgi:hypothetical protein